MALRPWTPSPDSTLGKLYMWAHAGGHENFCTEALAAAVRLDLSVSSGAEATGGGVLAEALGRTSDPSPGSSFPSPLPIARSRLIGLETQVPLGEGSGTLDMRLDFEAGHLWIEVKTGSPEGGGRLDGDPTIEPGTRRLDRRRRRLRDDSSMSMPNAPKRSLASIIGHAP